LFCKLINRNSHHALLQHAAHVTLKDDKIGQLASTFYLVTIAHPDSMKIYCYTTKVILSLPFPDSMDSLVW
jgi:hypothetical protein